LKEEEIWFNNLGEPEKKFKYIYEFY